MFQKIKNYIGYIVVAIIIVLIVIIGVQSNNMKILKSELITSRSNEKAFISENDSLKNKNLAFQFTIEQLHYFNDSIIDKMNDVKKELKIKDKDLKQMQYLLSEAQKVDTIVFRDTIFKDMSIHIDTLIGDEWYNMKLGLKYPNTIITAPTFKSEKFVIVNSRVETVDPPKKCFIARWFQKRHRVVEVTVLEKNPYIENKESRFIEILESK